MSWKGYRMNEMRAIDPGKGVFDDCCETTVKETGVSVEYVRPEVQA